MRLSVSDLPFSLSGPKTQALILLLVSSDEMCRGRRWLESQLWSSRESEQASGSLRQALAALRRVIDPDHELIISDRSSIRLNPAHVQVICESKTAENIAEGLVTRDPVFDAWLSDFREKKATLNSSMVVGPDAYVPVGGMPANSSAASDHPRIGNDSRRVDAVAPSENAVLLVQPGTCTDPIADMVASYACGQVAKNLSDVFGVDLHVPGSTDSVICGSRRALGVKSDAVLQGDFLFISMRLQDIATNELLMKEQLKVSANITQALDDPGLLRVAHQASEIALEQLHSSPNGQNRQPRIYGLYARAMRELFSFDGSRLHVADELFKSVYEQHPEPALIAWRSFLRMVMLVERTEKDPALVRAEAQALKAEAMEAGNCNAEVLAILAHVHLYLHGDVAGSMRLAQDALKLNPGNPMAHNALATASRLNGDIDAAQSHAARGLEIVTASPNRHWWYMASSLAFLAAGNYKQAIFYANSASAYAPCFRPPLRYLYAIHLFLGDVESAATALVRLKEVEPEFSLSMVRESEDYPAGQLQTSGLLELQDL